MSFFVSSAVGIGLGASALAAGMCKLVRSAWLDGTVKCGKDLKFVLEQCGKDEYQLLNLKYYQVPAQCALMRVQHDFLLIEVKNENNEKPLYIKAEKIGSAPSLSGGTAGRVTGISVNALEEDELPVNEPIYQVRINRAADLKFVIDVLVSFPQDYNLILENCWKYAGSAAQQLLMVLNLEEEAQELVDAVNNVHNGELAHFFQSTIENITVLAKLNERIADKKRYYESVRQS